MNRVERIERDCDHRGRLPRVSQAEADRGYAWYMFAQSVREILVNENRIVVKYELQDDYKLPFRRFYL